MLDIAGVAERIHKPRGTVDSYRARGQLPPPDDFVRKHPVWKASTIDEWWRKFRKTRRRSSSVAARAQRRP